MATRPTRIPGIRRDTLGDCMLASSGPVLAIARDPVAKARQAFKCSDGKGSSRLGSTGATDPADPDRFGIIRAASPAIPEGLDELPSVDEMHSNLPPCENMTALGLAMSIFHEP